MTGPKEKELAGKWHERINTSRHWRDNWSENAGTERYIKEYSGVYDVTLGNLMVPAINEVFSYCQSLMSLMSHREPYIAVNPKRKGSIKGAVILEAAINYYWRELKIKQETDLELLDAILVGHAWNKTGINVKTSGSGSELKLVSENLFANRVSWRDMVFNIGTKRPPHGCLWMAQRIFRPVDDVKDDYGAKAKNIKGSPYPDIKEDYRRKMTYKEDINFAELWEVHDSREQKIYLISDEITDRFLEDPRPWPSYVKEFPFEMLSFNDVPDEPYPLSDIAPWEAQVLEKIKVFTQALNHVKRWNRQMVITSGLLKDSELDKFEKGVDGTVLSANKGDLATGMRTLDFGALPPDSYQILSVLDQIKRETNGQPEFDKGANTKTGTRTLGELKLIQGGANSRMGRKIARFEMHCENIARNMMAHIQANFDTERIAKITGNEPMEVLQAFGDKFDPVSQTIIFNKEDIKGEYDIDVKSGSTLPLDVETRDAVLDQVLQMGVQLASAPSLPPFVAEVIKERLRDFGIKGLEEAFDKQVQALAVQDSQKGAMAQVGVAKTQSETEKRQAQARQIQLQTLIEGHVAAAKAGGLIPLEQEVPTS